MRYLFILALLFEVLLHVGYCGLELPLRLEVRLSQGLQAFALLSVWLDGLVDLLVDDSLHVMLLPTALEFPAAFRWMLDVAFAHGLLQLFGMHQSAQSLVCESLGKFSVCLLIAIENRVEVLHGVAPATNDDGALVLNEIIRFPCRCVLGLT